MLPTSVEQPRVFIPYSARLFQTHKAHTATSCRAPGWNTRGLIFSKAPGCSILTSLTPPHHHFMLR